MKAILFSGVQDFKRLLSNALFWVLTATLILIILVVNLALPAELKPESYGLITYNLPAFTQISKVAESEEALREAVRSGDVVGLIGSGNGFIVVHPGLSDKTINALLLSVSGILPESIPVTLINGESAPLPFNKSTVPIFVCFEALVTGFILGGALMLAEKSEEIVRALRISPLGSVKYILSKTLLFSVLGTLYSTLIAVFTVGFGFSWGAFLPLAFFGTAVFTLIGLAFTALFRGMGGWFFTMALLLSLNMLPVMSYTSSSFSPAWMKLIPSYPILLAFRAAMFGGSVDVIYTSASIAIWFAATVVLAYLSVSRLFFKEVRA